MKLTKTESMVIQWYIFMKRPKEEIEILIDKFKARRK